MRLGAEGGLETLRAGGEGGEKEKRTEGEGGDLLVGEELDPPG